MINFVLRLFVVLAVGFVISSEVVDRSAGYLFEPVSDAYVRESLRGQIYSLVQELSKVEPDARDAYIAQRLAPHYGLGLRVVNASDYNASDNERQIAAKGDFFIRDHAQTFVAAIAGPGGQWLELKLPQEPSFGPWLAAAVYSALGLLLCVFMLGANLHAGASGLQTRHAAAALGFEPMQRVAAVRPNVDAITHLGLRFG